MGKTRLIVGVTGPSCSFKTTVCEQIERRFPEVSRVRGDAFYLGAETAPVRHGLKNWESPKAVDLVGLSETLHALKEGADKVLLPCYSRAQHARDGYEEFVPRGGVILLDSLFALHDQIVDALDLRVVLDIPDLLVWKRRRERQGDAYTMKYHECIMMPSLRKARALWWARAQVTIHLREDMTSDQAAERLIMELWERNLLPRLA